MVAYLLGLPLFAGNQNWFPDLPPPKYFERKLNVMVIDNQYWVTHYAFFFLTVILLWFVEGGDGRIFFIIPEYFIAGSIRYLFKSRV